MSEYRESFRRIVRRWLWSRRIRYHAWGVWYGLVDWVLDRIYGAPHEARRKNVRAR